MAPRAIIHMDLDAFFVAVERLDQPALAGLPVIVGGRPEGRGVVASASYEARRFGVHSAMPTATALRLCPQAVLVPGHRARYAAMSQHVMALLGASAPLLEQVSIDEAFLDVTGTEFDWAGESGPGGGPGRLARALQDRVQAELGLSASFGVVSNKLVAKIASDLRKPHGIMVVPPGTEAAFLAPLPLARLWGAGPVRDGPCSVWASRSSAIWRLCRCRTCVLGSGLTARGCGAGPRHRRRARRARA